jgi:hypothetical protein
MEFRLFAYIFRPTTAKVKKRYCVVDLEAELSFALQFQLNVVAILLDLALCLLHPVLQTSFA